MVVDLCPYLFEEIYCYLLILTLKLSYSVVVRVQSFKLQFLIIVTFKENIDFPCRIFAICSTQKIKGGFS